MARHDPQSARLLANQDKLIAMARRFEAEEPGLSLHGFLARFAESERLAQREAEGAPEQDGASLTLLTVHQAKGLEYPLVIVPDLGSGLHAPPSAILIGRDGRLGMKHYIESEAELTDTVGYRQTLLLEKLARGGRVSAPAVCRPDPRPRLPLTRGRLAKARRQRRAKLAQPHPRSYRERQARFTPALG